MLAKVDNTRKVTISLGGACKLRCSHCYITAPQFRFQSRQTIDKILAYLEGVRGEFDAICISGDIDPLLEQERFCELLDRCAIEFPEAHLMFTTRLIPMSTTLASIREIGSRVLGKGKLLAPAVSFLTYRYPNGIENYVRDKVSRTWMDGAECTPAGSGP